MLSKLDRGDNILAELINCAWSFSRNNTRTIAQLKITYSYLYLEIKKTKLDLSTMMQSVARERWNLDINIDKCDT